MGSGLGFSGAVADGCLVCGRGVLEVLTLE